MYLHFTVRSLASVSLRKAEYENFHFNFFTLDLAEDLGALYGPVLEKQAEFARLAIRRILRLYKKNRPSSVVIFAHSMVI